MVVAGMVNAIPISDFPMKRNSELTKGFYGAGWYALLAATGKVEICPNSSQKIGSTHIKLFRNI